MTGSIFKRPGECLLQTLLFAGLLGFSGVAEADIFRYHRVRIYSAKENRIL